MFVLVSNTECQADILIFVNLERKLKIVETMTTLHQEKGHRLVSGLGGTFTFLGTITQILTSVQASRHNKTSCWSVGSEVGHF